jgi:AAA15 family ATPase/GTPase
LTEASERNVPEIRDIIKWFDDVLVVVPAEARVNALEVKMHMFRSRFEFAAEFLKTAGTGIDHINTTEEPFDIDGFNSPLKDDARQEILQAIAKLESEGDIIEAIDSNGRRLHLMKAPDGRPVRISMALEHRTSNGNFVSFDIEEESDGTQRLIHLLPALLMLKGAPEKVVVLDELDRRFHTLLSRRLLQFALNCDDEHLRSQLIFTTHDTNLLDLDLLRRDEIWFVEKDRGGASHLYSLAEYKVRPDLKIEKGYLNGRFGAIPFSGEPQLLGWLSSDATVPDDSVTEPASVVQ